MTKYLTDDSYTYYRMSDTGRVLERRPFVKGDDLSDLPEEELKHLERVGALGERVEEKPDETQKVSIGALSGNTADEGVPRFGDAFPDGLAEPNAATKLAEEQEAKANSGEADDSGDSGDDSGDSGDSGGDDSGGDSTGNDEYDNMEKADLVQAADARGLGTSGSAETLRGRLRKADEA